MGCPRQLDVLIYDQQDFSPVFRQGSMVVVPLGSVRAVIEVKSRLTKKGLRDSLQLLSDIPDPHLYGSGPPLFRGIFAFQSSISEDRLRAEISAYYNPTSEQEKLEFREIDFPYSHLTSLCVHESAYLFTRYRKNGSKKVRPIVQSIESLTDLKPQSGLFWTHLSAYLRNNPIMEFSFDVERILGADIYTKGETFLAPDNWGPYEISEVLEEEEVETRIVEAENLVARIQRWLSGDAW